MITSGHVCVLFTQVFLLFLVSETKGSYSSFFMKTKRNLLLNQSDTVAESISTTLSIKGQDRSVNPRILYDEEFQDLSLELSRLIGSRNGVMLSQSKNKKFKHLLTPSAGRTVLVVLCSPEVIKSIFAKIKSEKYDSHFILWLVVLKDEEDLDEVVLGLGGRMEEGTEVILMLKESSEKWRFYATRLDTDGALRFSSLGAWDLKDKRSQDSLPDVLTPDRLKPYSNFQGRELTNAVNNNPPFMLVGRVTPEGTNLPPSGIDFSIANTLQEVMNFTFRLVRPPDGTWGGPLPNGTVTGLVGMVYYKEATFSLSSVTLIGPRESVVDFSYPYYQDSLCLVSKAPQQKNRAFAVFSPFTLQVWLCVIAATLSIAPIAKIQSIGCSGAESSRSISEYSFNMFRNMVLQGNMMDIRHWSLRSTFALWYIFCVLVAALYSGTLTAVLAIPSYEKPIDSLTDLPQAVKEGFTVGTVKETMIEYLLRGATEGIYKQTWNLMNHKGPFSSLLENPAIGFNKILREKFVFIAPTAVSGIATATRGRSRFHIGRRTFYPMSYGIACATGSPLKDKFSQLLSRLVEGGLISKWRDDEFLKVMKISTDENESNVTQAITLVHLQAAFFLLLLGFVLASTTLLTENCYEKLLKSQKS